jgi:hypothetical protein
MHKKSHPWRESAFGTKTSDLIASSRSPRFSVYLQALQSAERKRIELAERKYVERTSLSTSRQTTAARDYAEGLGGVKED